MSGSLKKSYVEMLSDYLIEPSDVFEPREGNNEIMLEAFRLLMKMEPMIAKSISDVPRPALPAKKIEPPVVMDPAPHRPTIRNAMMKLQGRPELMKLLQNHSAIPSSVRDTLGGQQSFVRSEAKRSVPTGPENFQRQRIEEVETKMKSATRIRSSIETRPILRAER